MLKVIIESSLDIWVTRNKELYGAMPKEQKHIQREKAIKVVQQKCKEVIRLLKMRSPMLYRLSYIQLYDRSTFQLLKWIEAYEESWRTLNKENALERRRLFSVIKKAYRHTTNLPRYVRMSLFGESKSTLIRRSTVFLNI